MDAWEYCEVALVTWRQPGSRGLDVVDGCAVRFYDNLEANEYVTVDSRAQSAEEVAPSVREQGARMPASHRAIYGRIADLGREGWELTGVLSGEISESRVYFFKRRLR